MTSRDTQLEVALAWPFHDRGGGPFFTVMAGPESIAIARYSVVGGALAIHAMKMTEKYRRLLKGHRND